MRLSGDQDKALRALLGWTEQAGRGQFVTMGGYAGTGKTTLIAILRELLHKKDKKKGVAFAAYTGKAARVLRRKLAENKAMYEGDSCSTIHSLIYSPILNKKEEIVGWERKKEVEAELIIIDEASMVDEVIWRDLRSYGVPIIAVGDHGQLPPVRGSFNLMEEPEIRLEEIHRQAKDNPIIKLSIMARERGVVPAIDFGAGVKKIKKNSALAGEEVEEALRGWGRDTLVLCGYNFTRVKLNQFIRGALEKESALPEAGDRVICLRNNHTVQVYNGMLGTIVDLKDRDEEWYEAEIELDGEDGNYRGKIYKKQFGQKEGLNFTQERRLSKEGDLFDFGYALTVHKAQGSQARKVVLFEERFAKMSEDEWRRWLYTGITRAEEELLIVGS